VVLLVDGEGPPTETYSLRATVGAPVLAIGDVCSMPKPIQMSGTLLAESTIGLSNDYLLRGTCQNASGTDVVVYVIISRFSGTAPMTYDITFALTP
jgi:hypothetical protein